MEGNRFYSKGDRDFKSGEGTKEKLKELDKEYAKRYKEAEEEYEVAKAAR